MIQCIKQLTEDISIDVTDILSHSRNNFIKFGRSLLRQAAIRLNVDQIQEIKEKDQQSKTDTHNSEFETRKIAKAEYIISYETGQGRFVSCTNSITTTVVNFETETD